MVKLASTQSYAFYFAQGGGGNPDGPTEYTNATMLFTQATAPTGWTKVTTYDDYALRITNSTVSTGGTVSFSTALADRPVTGSISNTTFSIAPTTLAPNQIPSHAHTYTIYNGNPGVIGSASPTIQIVFSPSPGQPFPTVVNQGVGAAHTHTSPTAEVSTFTAPPLNMAVKYVDAILATYPG